MPRNRRGRVVVVLVLVLSTAALVALRSDQEAAAPQAPADATPAERAAFGSGAIACEHVAKLEAVVIRNGPADDAERHVRLAEEAARAAVELDPQWVPLYGATMALRVSIVNDDASAADAGIRSAHAQCARFRR